MPDDDEVRLKREMLVSATARQAMEKLSPDHIVQVGPNAFAVEWKNDGITVLVTAECQMPFEEFSKRTQR